MNDISKHYSITLNTKGSNILSSDQLLFNHGDDITININVVEDSTNKNLSQAKVDLLLLHESDINPVIHRFEDGGINISDNVVTILCKSSYINKIGVSVCQLIIRDEDQSITTQMFSYKTGSTLVSDEISNAADKIDTLVELDKTIENCKNKILETSNLLLQIDGKADQLLSKVENEILSVDSILREVERAEGERVTTFEQIKRDNESLKINIEDTISNVRDGVTPNISIGNVTTLDPGAPATVIRRGSDENPIFDFGIPKGVDGVDGGNTNIDDNTISKTSTWSSKKIEDFVHTNDDVVWSIVQGENLSVDYSKEGYLREVEIWGNTWQDDTDSKNLIDNNDGYILKGYSDDILNHKICTIEKSKMKVGTKYTLSTKTVLGSDARLNLYGMLDGTPTNICQMFSTTSRTITLDTDYDEYLLCAYAFANTESIGYKLEGVQLEEGDTATDYVDYHKADLSNIKHLGELYVDEEGQPILDGEGREQYKVEIISSNLYNSSISINEFSKITPINKSGFTAFNINNIEYIIAKLNDKSLIATQSFGIKIYHTNLQLGIETKITPLEGFEDYLAIYNWNNIVNGGGKDILLQALNLGHLELSIKIKNKPLIHNNLSSLVKSYKTTLLSPCQLMKVGDVADRLYWDSSKGRYIVEKNIAVPKVFKNLPLTTHTYEINGNKYYSAEFTSPVSFINNTRNILSTKLKCNNSIWGNIDSEGIRAVNNAIMIRVLFDKVTDITTFINDMDIYIETSNPQLIETNITKEILVPCYKDKTHLFVTGGIDGTIKAKIPLDGGQAIQSLSARNVALIEENEEIKKTNTKQDELIDVSLCATDEMFVMLEPILEMFPQTINLEREVSKMVDLYVAMVMRGLKTIEQIPVRYREQVKEILAQLEK